jgi:adenine-specific DNA-methyltransferase
LARVDELVDQIPDARLRAEMAAAIADIRRRHNFGLVFEQHIPETTLLADGPFELGQLVQHRRDPKSQSWRIVVLNKTTAVIELIDRNKANARQKVAISDLLTIKRFGDPIYPALLNLGEVRRHTHRPSHVVIEGENYHALQLLVYLHEGDVDCIYIDPPYNTGARDWKYNNRLVDAKDDWRHSKWLSMMDRRLRLAKRLLRPDGVLIVTIDEHEVHHLGMLLESIFPNHLRHMVTIIINPKGTGKLNFGRVDEYAIFCVPNVGRSLILGSATAKVRADLLDTVEIEAEATADVDDESQDDAVEPADEEGEELEAGAEVEDDAWSYPFPRVEMEMWELRHARRRGSESGYRHQRPNQFYPIFIDPKARVVVRVGDSIPLDAEPRVETEEGLTAIWPIDKEGNDRAWRYIPESMRALVHQKRLVVGQYNRAHGTWTLNYWVKKATHKKLKTVWTDTAYDAGTHGTTLLHSILGERGLFPVPKSVYAVRDCLAAVVRNRPTALIVDFFGGSGTTLHSTALLNASDGGSRRCILVTNNEVNDKAVRRLQKQGYFSGDPEYEAHGIFQKVTRPRVEAVLTGKRPSGKAIPGADKDGRPFGNGLEENVTFYRLTYLNPDRVELGSAFGAVLPLLWLGAGARGNCPAPPKNGAPYMIAKEQRLAVLLLESHFAKFRAAVLDADDISHIYLVTDSEEAFAEMRSELPRRQRIGMLYRDYLRSFRINTERAR